MKKLRIQVFRFPVIILTRNNAMRRRTDDIFFYNKIIIHLLEFFKSDFSHYTATQKNKCVCNKKVDFCVSHSLAGCSGFPGQIYQEQVYTPMLTEIISETRPPRILRKGQYKQGNRR